MTNEQPDSAPQEPTWHLQSPPVGQTPVPQVIAQSEPDPRHPTAVDATQVLSGGYPDPTAPMASIDPGSHPSSGASPYPSGGRSRRRTFLMTAGLLGAGVVAGVVAVAGLQSLRSTPTAQTGQTQAGQGGQGQGGQVQGVQPQAGQDGQLQDGQLQGGQLQGGQPGQPTGGQPGGMDGEQRVIGTVTAKSGSTLTVALTSGSVTVQVLAQTEIVNNGVRGTLAQVAVGSKVFMHTYPLNGATVAERIFVGTVPQGGPGGGPGGGPDDGQMNGGQENGGQGTAARERWPGGRRHRFDDLKRQHNGPVARLARAAGPLRCNDCQALDWSSA